MRDRFENVIKNYVPKNALGNCTDLWEASKFSFKITKPRSSKLGDYRYDTTGKLHIITVNGSLNPYSFLITYIHEIAHMHVRMKYGRQTKPHGQEWKYVFKGLMLPLLNPDVFPDAVLMVLARHMKNPKASSLSDRLLVKALRYYDDNLSIEIPLMELENGKRFFFQRRYFEKIESKRTRAVCQDMKSGKKYLIAETAMVKKD